MQGWSDVNVKTVERSCPNKARAAVGQQRTLNQGDGMAFNLAERFVLAAESELGAKLPDAYRDAMMTQ